MLCLVSVACSISAENELGKHARWLKHHVFG